MQLAFEAIHNMDALIFPTVTGVPTDWDAVTIRYRDAARLAAITIWRHLLYLADPAHRWPTAEIPGAKPMLNPNIAEHLHHARHALDKFEQAILRADPTAQITWERILEALTGMVTTIGPVLDHLLSHFDPYSKTQTGAAPPNDVTATPDAHRVETLDTIPAQSVNRV